jgi:hypothetical protein
MQHAERPRLGLTNHIIKAVHVTSPLSNIGELGTVTVNTNWVTVVLKGDHYRKPVVFCGVPTGRGSDASVCRINRLRYSPTVFTTVDCSNEANCNKGSAVETGCGGWCFEVSSKYQINGHPLYTSVVNYI